MTAIIAIVLFIVVLGGLIVITRRTPKDHPVTVGHIDDDVWDAARTSVAGSALQPLVAVGRPFAKVPMVWDTNSSFHRYIQRKLLAAGGVFGGSVEVYMSVQIGCIVGAGVLVGLGLAGIFNALAMGAFALAVAVAPFAQVDSLARRRTMDITQTLPEFAELLLMPLRSGLSVLPAMEFCAARIQGPVAVEVRNMLTLIRTRAMSEEQAFTYIGERLGTTEARSFFSALLTAHLEGAQVIENLTAQADGLRAQMYQYRRAEAKKLPVKLVLIFGIHLLPLLFVIALIPAIVALASF